LGSGLPAHGTDRRGCGAQVVEFVRGEKYARFSRIVFDTAPTGHTLRLLTVPDFVEASLGKLIRLRKKLAAAGGAVRGLFGASEQQDEAVAKLERLKVRAGAPGPHCWGRRRARGRLGTPRTGWRPPCQPSSNSMCECRRQRDTAVPSQRPMRRWRARMRHATCACADVAPAGAQESVAMVRELFRDQAATEFIIATIPTVLGINESARLLQALRKERIPCKRIIVNQVRRHAAPRRRPQFYLLTRARACQRGASARQIASQLGAARRRSARRDEQGSGPARRRPATEA